MSRTPPGHQTLAQTLPVTRGAVPAVPVEDLGLLGPRLASGQGRKKVHLFVSSSVELNIVKPANL